MPRRLIKVMLDSGAYTAWRDGKSIDVNDYIKFIKCCEPFLHSYVNLDVIPARPGGARTIEETKASAAKSYANLQTMKDAGLRPLPVFHQGEEVGWLEKMLQDGEEYIGLATAKNMPWHVQQQWLDVIFAAITDRAGYPLVKIHGFGIARVDWLKRFPFFSVDSAGWLQAAAYGKLYVPRYSAAGLPNFLCEPHMVTVSGRFQKSKYSQARQLNGTYFRPEEKQSFAHFIEHEAQLTVGEVKDSAASRAKALAIYYQRVIAELPTDIRFLQPRSMRPNERRVWEWLMASRPPFRPLPRFFFVTGFGRTECQILLEAGATDHLLSFWELRKRPEVIEPYASGLLHAEMN
jgi:hypothetical protein